MNQQINLYQPIFRKERIVFSAQTIAVLALGFGLILVLWAMLISYRIGNLEAELDRQLAAEQRAIGQLADLQRDMPPSEPDTELAEEVEALSERRDDLSESLDILARRLPERQRALGERVDALARRVPEGLWLTGMEMGENGNRLSVRGRALSPRLVPDYVDALSSEPLLSGLGLRRVRVEASQDATPGVIFTLSTEAEEQP